MKKLRFFLSVLLIFCLASKANGQTFTQTFVDKCSGELKVATTTYVNGSAYVSFYDKMRVFSPAEVASGVMQVWLQSVYIEYSTVGCPTNLVVQQTVQQTVNQAVAAAAQQAATQAASSAANSAASSAASNAASSAASSSASSATSSAATPPTPAASSNSSSSSNNSSSSSESKSETKSESKSESKSEEESKTESKKEEKKEESKKEEKKKESKSAPINPLLIASDLSVVQTSSDQWSAILSIGMSRSSLMGDKSYSLNSMTWSNLKQFALSGGITKMNLNDKGSLTSINSFSLTTAYLSGSLMALGGFTKIIPNPKLGTYGYNMGVVTLLLQNTTGGFDVSMSNSSVVFWTKPYPQNKKLTLSPQIFVIPPGMSVNTKTGEVTYGNTVGILAGSSVDYKISKRFGFSFNYKINATTATGAPLLSNFLIGSRMIL